MNEKEVDNIMESAISSFTIEEVEKCLKFIRDWNTDAKYTFVSQRVLYEIFKNIHPSSLLAIKEIKQILQGLIPYTERHFNRIERLARQSYLIDYTLSEMKVIRDKISDNLDINQINTVAIEFEENVPDNDKQKRKIIEEITPRKKRAKNHNNI